MKTENPIKLSICIIMKDEEKNIERCLRSLVPLFTEPWCELIVTDTGSKDNSVEIAKRYTDNVFEHEWENDFSKARNDCISHAVGHMVFIVDADDELPKECVSNLKAHLLDDTKDQPTWFITIRNFYNEDMKPLYNEFIQPRLFIRDGFYYEFPIHNKPLTLTPYLYLQDVRLEHYGYMFKNDAELFARKRERSLPMLLEEHRANPKDPHVLLHLLKTFRMIGDLDSTILYCEKLIKILDGIKFDEGWFAYLEVFISALNCYLRKFDLENGLRIYKQSLKYSDRVAQMPLLLGDYYAGKDNDLAAMYYEKAINIKKERGSPYEKLLSSNLNVLLPSAFNFLAIYWYQKGDLQKSGDYINLGITLNDGRVGIRWDVFNCGKLGVGLGSRYGGPDGLRLKDEPVKKEEEPEKGEADAVH
jgi:glycosyltransferase involved in cell wall biosynthesis